jgi:hypothetical protein
MARRKLLDLVLLGRRHFPFLGPGLPGAFKRP